MPIVGSHSGPFGSASRGHQRFRLPVGDQPAVERAGIVEREHGSELVQLVAGLRRPQACGQNTEQAGPAVGGQGAQGSRQAVAERSRQQRQTAPKALCQLIAVVAAEQFVAAVAGERHGDVLAGHRGDDISRDLRGIRKRLVVVIGQARNDVEGVFGGNGELGVLGVQMPGDRGGMRGFVVAGDVETDRIGAHRPGIGRLHQGDDRGGIDAARQEGADRNVGHHAPAHGVLEQRLQLIDQLAVVGAQRIGETRAARRRARPSSVRYAARRPRAG